MYFSIDWREVAKFAGIVLLVAAVFAALFVLGSRGCSDQGKHPDTSIQARDAVLEQYRAEVEADRKRVEQLLVELEALRFQVEQLDAEIAESVREREVIHNAIREARTIDDIDRALRAGIPGAGGR